MKLKYLILLLISVSVKADVLRMNGQFIDSSLSRTVINNQAYPIVFTYIKNSDGSIMRNSVLINCEKKQSALYMRQKFVNGNSIYSIKEVIHWVDIPNEQYPTLLKLTCQFQP